MIGSQFDQYQASMLRKFGFEIKTFKRLYTVKKIKSKDVKTKTKKEENVFQLPPGFSEGIQHMNSGKFEDSLLEFSKIEVQDPSLTLFIQYHKALSLFYLQKFTDAVKEFKKCVIPEDYMEELGPIIRALSIVIPFQTGLTYFQMKDIQQCLNYMNLTLAIDKHFAFASFYKSLCHFEFQQYLECNVAIEDALSIDRDHVQNVLRSASPMDVKKAHTIFDDDKEFKIYTLSLLERKAMSLIELGNQDLALSALEKALELDPDNVKMNLNRTFILFQSGKIDETLEAVDRVLKLDPKNYDCLVIQARVYAFDKKDLSKTFEVCDKILEDSPDNVEFLFYKAYVSFENKKFNEAEMIVDRIEERGIQFEDCIFLKGQILMEKHKNEEALNYFNRTLEMNSSNQDALYSKAVCLIEIGESKEARQTLEFLATLESNSNRADVLLNYIDVAEKKLGGNFKGFDPNLKPTSEEMEQLQAEVEKLHQSMSDSIEKSAKSLKKGKKKLAKKKKGLKK